MQNAECLPLWGRWHGEAVTDEVRSKLITHNSKLITSFPCRAGAGSRRICPGSNTRRDQGPALQGRCDNQALRTGQCPVPTNRLCGNGPSRTPVPTEQFRNAFCIPIRMTQKEAAEAASFLWTRNYSSIFFLGITRTAAIPSRPTRVRPNSRVVLVLSPVGGVEGAGVTSRST